MSYFFILLLFWHQLYIYKSEIWENLSRGLLKMSKEELYIINKIGFVQSALAQGNSSFYSRTNYVLVFADFLCLCIYSSDLCFLIYSTPGFWLQLSTYFLLLLFPLLLLENNLPGIQVNLCPLASNLWTSAPKELDLLRGLRYYFSSLISEFQHHVFQMEAWAQ